MLQITWTYCNVADYMDNQKDCGLIGALTVDDNDVVKVYAKTPGVSTTYQVSLTLPLDNALDLIQLIDIHNYLMIMSFSW